jgi:hypothetical protein
VRYCDPFCTCYIYLVYSSSLIMPMVDSQQGFIKCPDCDLISLSQGGLGVHRSKRHKITIPDEVKSLFVERIFQEGKPIYCCLCDVTIGSIPNFRRHMKNKHAQIKLIESAKCSLCGQKFPEDRGAGVHLIRKHDIRSNNSYSHSPTPVMSSTDRDGFNTPRSSCRSRKRANLPSSTPCQDHSHVHGPVYIVPPIPIPSPPPTPSLTLCAPFPKTPSTTPLNRS